MVENLIKEYKRAHSIRIMLEEKLQEMEHIFTGTTRYASRTMKEKLRWTGEVIISSIGR